MRTEEEAVEMIDPRNLDTLLHPQFDAAALKAAAPMGKALGASPGAACGKVVFTADDAKAWSAKGEKVILVRLETSPEDIEGMKAGRQRGQSGGNDKTRTSCPAGFHNFNRSLHKVLRGWQNNKR